MDAAHDAVFGALADPTRRAILDRLRAGRATTGQLAAEFPHLSRFAVMKHLGVLERAGLVLTQKEGRLRWNALNAVPLRRVYERWVSRYADLWSGAALALQRHIEGEAPMAQSSTESRVMRALVETEINAPRPAVFDGMVHGIARWWVHPAGPKPPMRIEPRVGGRFFEDHGDDRGHMFGLITVYEPPRKLRFIGDFTNREAVHNVVTIDFDELSATRTRVRIDHRAAGEVTDQFAAGFEEGWNHMAGCLKAFCEGGAS